MSQLQGLALVGDVGGTNARLSLVNLADGSLSNTKVYSSVENESLEKVIVKFREETGAKFDSDGRTGYNTSGGMNGVGAKATTALSESFTVNLQ